MITVERDNEKVMIYITTDLPFDCEHTHDTRLGFSLDQGEPHKAELLKRYMDKTIRDAIETAHRKAYERGYKDGKGKQRKEKWFPSWLNSSWITS